MPKSYIFEDLQTGLNCVCPKCKTGKIFPSTFSIETYETCPECGFNLSENDSADGPAVFMIFLLSFSVIPLALVIEYFYEWDLWLHLVIWGAVILGLTLGLMRPLKAYVIALQFRHLPDSME